MKLNTPLLVVVKIPSEILYEMDILGLLQYFIRFSRQIFSLLRKSGALLKRHIIFEIVLQNKIM